MSTLGAPTGTIPLDLQIAYGRGGPWSMVNRFDPYFVEYGDKHGAPPDFLKAMCVVETGGQEGLAGAGGASGVMQVKPRLWGATAATFGYDLNTSEGQVAFAAAIIGGDVANTRGMDPETAFLKVYYPTPGLDVPGESGHTPRQYLSDIARLRRIINAAVAEEEDDAPMSPAPPSPQPAPDPWRPYPYPKMVRLIVRKPYDGAGFDRVPFRHPNIRGFASHITDGPTSQSIEFFQGFFGIGGARERDALADLVIGFDGRIGLLNDWRDPNWGGTRAGWANGGTDGLEGDGIAFYRKYPAVNQVLVSCEHTARVGDRWSDAMIAATIEIRTAIAQELRCPWDTYPYHPTFAVSIEQQHRNFATKSCPAEPYISTYAPIVLREVKAKLKAWQGGLSTPVPLPPTSPALGRYGLPPEFWANEFGTLTRVSDGAELPFDPKGPVSLAWLERCEREGVWPEAEEWRSWDSALVPGKENWIGFSNGWRLINSSERSGWRWADELIREAKAE